MNCYARRLARRRGVISVAIRDVAIPPPAMDRNAILPGSVAFPIRSRWGTVVAVLHANYAYSSTQISWYSPCDGMLIHPRPCRGTMQKTSNADDQKGKGNKPMLRYVSRAAIMVGMLGVASAQPMGGGSFVGTTSETPSCPAVTLHVLRSGSTLIGTAFFVNGSGTSSIHGQTDGETLSWTMASVEGKGPVGEVTGTISPNGRLQIKKVGSSCTFETFLPMLNETGGRGQG
jgi:hypothetical protein